MVDFSTTASRVYGMFKNPQETLAYNSRPLPPWRVVAKEHVLPIIVASSVIHGLLLWALQPVYESMYQAAAIDMPEAGNLIFNTVLKIALQFAGVAIWAVVVGFFAGVLGGRNDFNAAYLLVALALTPHMISSALQPIPGLGAVLWLGTFIYAMVILYRGAPALVGVPSESRARHLALSLVSMVFATIVITLVLSPVLISTSGIPG